MKELILIRGCPGSGKSTFANILSGSWIEADSYFIDSEGNYKFDGTKLKDAHKWCQDSVENWMEWYTLRGCKINDSNRIIVSNTFTQEWEMKPYYELAEKYEYKVFSIIVENRHNGINEHGVPEDKLEIMKNRFEISL
jgi:predicted kinase